MILATWQPLVENNDKKNHWPELTGYLGYKPIFCFSAENEMDVIIGSALSSSNCPERLIVFETYEYKKINKVLWDKRQAEIKTKKKSKIKLADCFNVEDVPNNAIEYIVKGVHDEDLLLELPMEHMINNGITSDVSDIQTMTNDAIGGVQLYCKDIFTRVAKEKSEKEGKQIAVTDLTCHDKKSIVEWSLMPLWYSIAVENSMIPAVSMTYEDAVLYKIKEMIAEYLDPENPETKTQEFFTKICRAIKNCFMFFDFKTKDRYYKPEVNEKCPCGSMLKYKHCCGKKA